LSNINSKKYYRNDNACEVDTKLPSSLN